MKENAQKKIKYSRGVQAVLWGVCKITEKRKLGLRGKWTEPGRLEWVGLRADPGGMYIRVVRQKLPHFLFSFSLYLSSRERNSLLSPCSLLLHRRGERAAARQPAVVGGGAAAVKALFFTFFFALSYPPIFLHFSNLKNQRK